MTREKYILGQKHFIGLPTTVYHTVHNQLSPCLTVALLPIQYTNFLYNSIEQIYFYFFTLTKKEEEEEKAIYIYIYIYMASRKYFSNKYIVTLYEYTAWGWRWSNKEIRSDGCKASYCPSHPLYNIHVSSCSVAAWIALAGPGLLNDILKLILIVSLLYLNKKKKKTQIKLHLSKKKKQKTN